jgi:hypothetical protein
MARVKVLCQTPPGAQIAAADIEKPVLGPQPVPEQVVVLDLANVHPAVLAVGADRHVWVLGGFTGHDRAIEGGVVPMGEAEP